MLHTTHQGARRGSAPARLLVAGLTTALALTLASCSTEDTEDPGAEPTGTVTVVVHDSIVISDESKAAFEEASGLALEVVSAGDGGALANQLVLTKDSPLGILQSGCKYHPPMICQFPALTSF